MTTRASYFMCAARPVAVIGVMLWICSAATVAGAGTEPEGFHGFVGGLALQAPHDAAERGGEPAHVVAQGLIGRAASWEGEPVVHLESLPLEEAGGLGRGGINAWSGPSGLTPDARRVGETRPCAAPRRSSEGRESVPPG